VALGVAARSEIREARERMLLTRRLVDSYRGTLIPLRQEVASRALEHYNCMLIGAFDVLAAKRDEIEAYRAYVTSVRDYWVARSDLERALGRRLTVASNASKPAEPTAPTEPTSPPAAPGEHRGPQHGGH